MRTRRGPSITEVCHASSLLVRPADPRPDESREEIARRFQLAPATLYNWQHQEKDEGRTEAKPHNGGPKCSFDAQLIGRAVAEKNDRTIAELQVCYEEQTGRPISWSSVRRLLLKLGLTRKKKNASGRRAVTP